MSPGHESDKASGKDAPVMRQKAKAQRTAPKVISHNLGRKGAEKEEKHPTFPDTNQDIPACQKNGFSVIPQQKRILLT